MTPTWLSFLTPFLPVPPAPPTLDQVLAERLLTGLFIEDERLYLRFVDSVVTVDLTTRAFQFGGRKIHHTAWLSLAGWLRVTRVLEEKTQLTLEVSGALYTARIHARCSEGRGWFLIFSGGRGLASA